MMKCDMSYDRTSIGKKPMCASVCPSGALYYGTREEIAEKRKRSIPNNQFKFGNQTIATKVNMMIPLDHQTPYIDVLSAMNDHTSSQDIIFMLYEE